jgi:adenosylcobinamide kinase/adenosylcobinamide-phosphate guanylyltransferase
VIFVTNEVGLGIVPPDAPTRLYRNLVGRCGQAIGAAADAAVLVVCGMPITLKGDPGS